jgi:hypothetical protein
MGRLEHGSAAPGEIDLLRALTPITKAATGRWSIAGVTEAMEAVGGVGYCEDSSLPAVVRNTHVIPIWEGTTNVMALDFLRAAARSRGLEAIGEDIRSTVGPLESDPAVGAAVIATLAALNELEARAQELLNERDAAEAGARSIALGLAATYACSRLCAQGSWAAARGDLRTAAAAVRLGERGLVGPKPPRHLELGMDEEIAGAEVF